MSVYRRLVSVASLMLSAPPSRCCLACDAPV